VGQSNLPLIGVDAQVLNSKEYFKTLGEIEKVTNRVSKTLKDNSKTVDQGTKTVEKNSAALNKNAASLSKNSKDVSLSSKLIKDMSKNLDGLIQGLLSTVGVGGQFASTISSWVSGLVGAAAPIAAIVAGIVALVAVFVTLGNRSSEIEGVRNAFYALNAQFGVMADETLARLRTSSQGTISDFKLMETVNRSLAGSTDALGQAYLENFDELLAIAQVQARATGQSVEYLFDSLIRGIKRGSPLIIDNTYLVIAEAEAHERYAEQIGITVEALTDEQKQIALMEATVASGMRAIEAAGGVQLTTAMKIQQMGVTLQNTFDRAAMAIKPLWDLIVDGALFMLNIIIPILTVIIDFIGFTIKRTVVLARALVGWIASIFAPVISKVQEVWAFLTENIDAIAQGAGRMMAGYANGILEGLTKYVMPAIILVATAISRFLIGQSPPPEGPLSEIFNGGAAVMDSWIQGFVGASLDPVSQVAMSVSTLMGDIAGMTLKQVNQQIAQLSNFLKPFENRVAMLEARFKALDEIVQGAFTHIDEEQAALLEKLNAGDTLAAAQITALDVERDKWQDILDAQKKSLTDAQYQLALAKATTAARMSALKIRQAELDVKKKEEKVVKKVSEEKPGKEPKGKAADPSKEPGAFGDLAIPGESPEIDWLGANAFGENFMEGFTGTLDAGLVSQLTDQLGEVDSIIGGITPEAIGTNFQNMFTGVGDSIRDNFVTPIQEKVWDVINLFTGTEEGSVQYGISAFITGIPTFFANLTNQINTWFTNAWRNAATSVTNLFTATATPGTLAYNIVQFPTNIISWLGTLADTLLQNLTTPFGDAGVQVYDMLFNRENTESLASRFCNFFAGSGEGTLNAIIDTAVAIFANMPNRIVTALQYMGLIVWNSLVVPVLNGLNSIIDAINQFIQNNQALGDLIAASLGVVGLSFGEISIPRLNVAPPSFLASGTPQAKGGMTGGPGAVKVNERGQEGFVLGPATQMMTFPNTFLNTLVDIRDILVTAVAAPVTTSSAGNTSNITNNYNFNNTKSADDGRRTATMLRLFKK
jgi:hypothetical protein